MTQPSPCKISCAGETLELRPQGVVHWPAERVLLLADLHIGKTAAMRSESVAISDAPLSADLDRLSCAIHETKVRHVIVLGDLLHSVTGRTPETFRRVAAWRNSHADITFTSIRGNHDQAAGDPPPGWNFHLVDEPFRWGPFQLLHHPEAAEPSTMALAGHLHPKVQLSGRAGDRITLPCFWLRQNVLVLPAFSRFTGGVSIRPAIDDRVFAIVEEAVLEFPPSRNARRRDMA